MLDDLYQNNIETSETLDLTPEEYNEDYQFADGTLAPSEQLDAFIEEFGITKEEKNAPVEPSPKDIDELETGEEDEEEISNMTARNTAQFIVGITDDLASVGLAYIAKEKQDNFRAGKEQKKNLENILAKYCKEKGTEIPLPMQIIICLGSMYASKLPYAFDRRRINEERKEIENIRKELDKQRLSLERKLADVETERKALLSIREKMDTEKNGSAQ